MKTIDEWMEGQEPGSIKVAADWWLDGTYLIPFFKTRDGNWYGLDQEQDENCHRGDHKEWSLYTPPKKKVKIWQWLISNRSNSYYSSSEFFRSDEAAYSMYGSSAIQRLDHTEIEVEVEDD